MKRSVFAALLVFVIFIVVKFSTIKRRAVRSLVTVICLQPEHSVIGGVIIDKWVCTICQYIYDPDAGDPDGGIAPGTAFEDIPDDWVCPVCGAGKDVFEKVV